MTNSNENKYTQYTDFIFKKTVQKYANGVLKFLNIPYKIQDMILSEIANTGLKSIGWTLQESSKRIHRRYA